MDSFKSGDLAYLPSQAKLFQSDNTGIPRVVCQTDKPQNVLIVGAGKLPHESTILVDGQKWHTDTTNLYPIQEGPYDKTS
jgi:hypothetical protein